MENPILMNARLKVKRAAITGNESKIKGLEEKRNAILRAVEDATTTDEVDKAESDSKDVDQQIESLQKDVEKLQSDVSDIEKHLEDLNGGKDDEPKPEPTAQQNSKTGGVQRMKTIIKNEENEKEVRSLIDFINSKGEKRAGITTADIGAIIPKQIIYEAQDEIETQYDLTKFVDVIKVSNPGGTWNVAKQVDESLHTVAELAANPELKNPELLTIDWNVQTYRGAIENSNEAIQDATELKRLLQKTLDSVVLNTKNRLVVTSLKEAPAKAAPSVDDLKHIINVDLDPAYNKVVITSQSGYNYLDTLKDNDGRYLLQPDITATSGKRLLGLDVAVVADNLLGEKAGDQVAFVGDAKRFTKFFDRDQVQLGWVTNDNFAQKLLAAIRADVKTADTAAGYLVNLGAAVDETPKA